MGRRPKEDLSYFTNDAGEIQYNKHCMECPYPCKQSFRAVISCPRYDVCKKSLRKPRKSVDKVSPRMV